MGGLLGDCLGASPGEQLGPDQVPVLRPQGLAGDNTTGGSLNGNAVHRIGGGAPRAPVANNGLAYADSCGKFSHATSVFDCDV